MHGEYGIDDVCLSTMCVVGAGGMDSRIVAPLTDEEIAKLHKSADSLKAVLQGINI